MVPQEVKLNNGKEIWAKRSKAQEQKHYRSMFEITFFFTTAPKRDSNGDQAN